jgi:transcriptional regulator with XRE-family HTH domain
MRGDIMYSETFSKKLTKARQEAGFTQQEVANETKIKRTTLAGYETGRTQPDIETLGILSDFYGVSLDWLVGTGKNLESNKREIHKKNPKIIIQAKNMHNGNGDMFIELTKEQIKAIKES